MVPWQQEVVKALKELRPRIENLQNLLFSGPALATLSPQDQDGLKYILACMKQLEFGLERQIKRFVIQE